MSTHTAPRPHSRVRLSWPAVLAAAAVVTASVLTTGALGSVVAQPRPAVAPTAPAAPAARSTAPVRGSLVAASELPGGLVLPVGVQLVGSPTASTDSLGYRRWETDLELGRVPAAQALDELAATLTSSGFEVRRGSKDVFAARLVEGRWVIVVARVRQVGQGDAGTDVLALGIGSRAA